MVKFAIKASGAMLLPSLVQVSESISGSVVPLAMFIYPYHQGATMGTLLTIPAQFLVGRAMSANNKVILECEDRSSLISVIREGFTPGWGVQKVYQEKAG